MLIVEDEVDLRAMLAEALSNEGYEITTAGTAEDGLNLLRDKQFHLVVTDYRMPGQTGVWMLQKAAEAGVLLKAKALLITGESNLSASTGFKVLRKPLELDQFLRVVSDVLMSARTV